MKNSVVFSFIFTLAACSFVLGQEFPQMQRSIERRNRAIRADEERQRRKDEETGRPAAISKPKPAIMNVDVQIVLSRSDHKTFAEAKVNAINRVTDGEPLWLYAKFNGKLGDYVFAAPDSEDPARMKYMLFTEIGPQGDITSLNQYLLQFTKEDLSSTEIKINLAPGLPGRNRSIPLFLSTAGNAKRGVWHNEFRIANSTAVPLGANDYLAKSAVILDFSGGLAKYRKMFSDYDSVMLRGAPDSAKIPTPGTFFSETVKTDVLAKLNAEGIKPIKFFFSGDDWSEYARSTFIMRKERKIFATYTYQKAKECLYGVAEVVQTFDNTTSKFGNSVVTLKKDFPIQCAELN
ncbi:hypothetical protein BH18ACI3_BH18ACI3_18950 [soil metagenome]